MKFAPAGADHVRNSRLRSVRQRRNRRTTSTIGENERGPDVACKAFGYCERGVTMSAIAKGAAVPCRSITTEEVDHFHEFGWAKLQRFVDWAYVGILLQIARERMGDDADSNEGKSSGTGTSYFNALFTGGLAHPELRRLIEQVGKNAKVLMRRRSGIGVRYYNDLFVPKLPSSKTSKHGGNGPTAFHQDFMNFGVDRTGGMTWWLPLEAYGPDAGTMCFVSKSHRMGVLGDFRTYGAGDVFDVYPELRDLEVTAPMTYELGDVSVHSHLTIHGAGANITDKPRWAYMLLTQPADACWNGAPSPNFDSSDMKPWQLLDGERFPMIG